jgi:FKBP-type peptidyl-prolyl cis-trans isomerase
MKKLNIYLKVCIVVLFATVFVLGCKKTEVTDSSQTDSPETEALLIKNWLDTQVKDNKNIDTTATGLYYIVDKVGLGSKVKAGDTLTVKYTGTFMDGTVFDSSSNFRYIHKAAASRMIQGWEEAVEVMSKGGSALFLIPSAKAYGVNGYYPVIKPYAPLLFTIEIIDIK